MYLIFDTKHFHTAKSALPSIFIKTNIIDEIYITTFYLRPVKKK